MARIDYIWNKDSLTTAEARELSELQRVAAREPRDEQPESEFHVDANLPWEE